MDSQYLFGYPQALRLPKSQRNWPGFGFFLFTVLCVHLLELNPFQHGNSNTQWHRQKGYLTFWTSFERHAIQTSLHCLISVFQTAHWFRMKILIWTPMHGLIHKKVSPPTVIGKNLLSYVQKYHTEYSGQDNLQSINTFKISQVKS